jgi:hypothetical protein
MQWNILWKISTVILGLVMFAAQVGPDEAVSNISKWMPTGLESLPTWLIAKSADRLLFLWAFGVIVILLWINLVWPWIDERLITSQRNKQRKVKISKILKWAMVFVIASVLFGVTAWLRTALFPPQVVTVVPDTFVLHTGEWFQKTRTIVTNVTDKPVYGVQIYIWSDNPRINISKAVELEKYAPSPEPNLPSPDIIIVFEDDSVEVRLSELLGHEERSIIVTGPSMPAKSGTAHGFARITAFSDTSQDLYIKPPKE